MAQDLWAGTRSDERAVAVGSRSPVQIIEAHKEDDGVVIDLRSRERIVEPESYVPTSGGLLEARGWSLAAKRAVDIVGAMIAFLVLSPVFLVAVVAVALTSPGPVLFAQERVGLDGTPFKMLKFRSMYRDAETLHEKLESLNAHQTGPIFKIYDDPRVTPVGRIIRKLSIDELPQLLNVLGGSMTLVGPRPPVPREVSTYSQWQAQRLLVKPGITCIWQVSGRSDIDFDTWVKMDLEYIETWSLGLDLQLMARTIPAVLTMRGAY